MTILDEIGNTFSAIGHDIGVFVTQTIPKTASDIYHDVTGIVKDVVHIPSQAIQTGGQTIQKVIPAATQNIADVFGSVFNSPVLIVGAIAAALVVPKLLR